MLARQPVAPTSTQLSPAGDRDGGLADPGEGCYDWAVSCGQFRPSKAHHGTPLHVAGFSPSLEHVHVVDGTVE
ncbi:DUF7710 domain-containing protein [Krasilnikovia cinnamomea]|uniref:DUF7710 domain-containing protein n=1 Tax=Krasilnikovia cinnamomea TaxID=349313 RepID=UPI003BF843D9